MDLTQNQKKYFDKIRNKKLKLLLSSSYTFFSMTGAEKDEFLTWVGVIHNDHKAENELIKTFQDEATNRDKLFSDPKLKDPTGADKQKQEDLLVKQGKEFDHNLKKAKKYVLVEKELDSQAEDKEALSELEKKLNQT